MRSRSWLWRVVLGAAVVAGVAWSVSGRLPGTAAPSATPQPAAPGIDRDLLAEGARAEVAIVGLRLVDAPGGEPFADIEEGIGVAILGSAEHEDVLWWLVQVGHRGGDLFGWVPDLLEGASTLSAMEPSDCPEEPSQGHVGSQDPADRLRCWGGERLVFEGWVVTQQLDAAYTGRPAWLADAATLAITRAIGPAVNGPSLPLHLPPGIEQPPLTPRDGPIPDSQVRITGHFDDQRSGDCGFEPVIPRVPPLDEELSTYWCRQRFVVAEWVLIPET